MSLHKKVICDECLCAMYIDDDDSLDSVLQRNHWKTDPEAPWQHYCGPCWQIVKKRFAELV